MNPLDMRGPDFLQFYLIYGLGLLAAAWLLRAYWRSASAPPGAARWGPGIYPREGDAYHIALLRGGPDEVVRAALGHLLARGLIVLDGRTLRRAPAEVEPRLAAVESEALRAVAGEPGGMDAARAGKAVRGAIEPFLALMEEDLRQQGLIPAASQLQSFRGLRTVVLLAVPGLGLVKLVKALSEGRTNVGFLVLLAIAYAVAALFALQPPRRTGAGDKYLAWLRESHKRLVDTLSTGRQEDLSQMALVAGIYGLAVLPSTSPLERALRPPADAGSASGCGGGDGGGGGGGCGGGGCGGCGGG